MDKDKRKALKEKYENRRPEMGIACWQSGDAIWACVTKNAEADYNSTSFRLQLGSYPNRELQSAYSCCPESFSWCLAEKLDYKDTEDDHSEDLQLLLMMFLEKHPDAKPMRPGKKFMR